LVILIKPLFASGRLNYGSTQGGGTDVKFMQERGEDLLHLHNGMKKLNGSWKCFKAGILKLMLDPDFPALKGKEKDAEEEATKLRTIGFHIRREWYRKSELSWMAPFPAPVHADDAPPAQNDSPPVQDGSVSGPAETVVSDGSATDMPGATNAAASHVAAAGSSASSFSNAFGMEVFLPLYDGSESPLPQRGEEPREGFSPSALADDSSDDGDEHEIRYIYGHGGQGQQAWRQLVTGSGEQLDAKESASHVTDRGVGRLIVAHFLDGTSHEVDGMFGGSKNSELVMKRPAMKRPAMQSDILPVLKRPAMKRPAMQEQILKRPAAHLAAASAAAMAAGPAAAMTAGAAELAALFSSDEEEKEEEEEEEEEEEDGLDDDEEEEEDDGEQDEEEEEDDDLEKSEGEQEESAEQIGDESEEEEDEDEEPEEENQQRPAAPAPRVDLVGQWAIINQGCQGNFENRGCQVIMSTGVHEQWAVNLIPDGEALVLLEREFTVVVEKVVMSYFKATEEKDGAKFRLAGTSQGDRYALFLLTKNGKQIGMISTRPPLNDLWKAWIMLRKIWRDMVFGVVECSKVGFYARREELMDEMLGM
jgi:hypothetical protein